MIAYTPPTTADLQRLKDTLGLSGEQMAALASVAGGSQWRKYTGGAEPRALSLHMHFFIAARLCLPDEDLARIGQLMRQLGAGIDPLELTHVEGLRADAAVLPGGAVARLQP